MSDLFLAINGHFRTQRPAGVHRYAREILSEFGKQNISYSWVQPPAWLRSDVGRQLWMQSVMPFKVSTKKILWSPTNIGPIACENQVLTLHDIADQLHPEWFDRKYVAWRRVILPRLLHRVRRVITVSEFSRDTIVDFYPQVKGKIDVIYNGVRHSQFYPRQEEEIEQLRKDYELEKPFVLTVGSLDQRKNIGGLLDAWHQLPDSVTKSVDLVITGETARKFVFKRAKNDDPSVRFTGYVEDTRLPIFYSAAALFVYPSLFEGFGLPVLEAMACGTAVITSNTTALKEVAGDNALTVNPHSSEAIAGGLTKLLNSRQLRAEHAAKGKRHAQKFCWDKAAQTTFEVLQQCAK